MLLSSYDCYFDYLENLDILTLPAAYDEVLI